MSFHNKPDYHIPELIEALKAHRLPHDTPSQLADSFRIGWMACCRELAQADSGFDHKTAADFLSGKTVSDEALRKFVAASRGAHDARAALHAKMLSLQGELASREAEIALLKRSLLDAEADAAAPQPPTAPAGAGMGHTDGGRNMFYEGRFDGESQREQQARLRWANDMRAAFERHTGNGWFDKDWRTETGLWSSAWHACLAAQPTPAAQAADSVQEDALRERDEADDFIDTLLDEVLGADRAEWSSAYGRAEALEDVRERITALHKPTVDRAWKQFEAATKQPGDVVAYLDVGAGGYLDLDAALSDEAMQQLPKGRHALVIAGTYGIDGYVAAPQPSPTAQAADSVQEDAARLDWLLLRISGAEFRRLGVHYSGNARRADVDAARKQGEAMTTDNWEAITETRPAQGVAVLTKIDGAGGPRNTQVLVRTGNLWFFPDMSMYVYYTPTHFKEQPHDR